MAPYVLCICNLTSHPAGKSHIDVMINESAKKPSSIKARTIKEQGRIQGGGGAKGAVAPLQPRNIGFFNTKMDPSPPPSSQCSPLKLESIVKLTTKIHQKCQKLAFLLPFVLDLGRFVGVAHGKWAWSKNFRALGARLLF